MRASMLMPLAVVAVLAGACADQSITAPAATRGLQPSGDGPSLNVVQGRVRFLTVCAEGPAGSYSYSMNVTSTSKNTIVTPMGNNYTLASGQCADVVRIDQAQDFEYGDIDPNTNITVTQTSAPAGTQLDFVQKTQQNEQAACVPGDTFPCGVDTRESGPTSTIILNFYHGSVMSFWSSVVPSSEPAGCTLTQGYWKNHPSAWPDGYSPSASFFSSGMTWMETLKTPPKGGNAYLILAHQWIAATLNMANGATMPASVQSAYDNGEHYLATGNGSDPIGWASTLDEYNNGLAAGGPNHCGDAQSGGDNDHGDHDKGKHEDRDDHGSKTHKKSDHGNSHSKSSHDDHGHGGSKGHHG